MSTTRQTDTRREYRVIIRTPLGTKRTEWMLTLDAAEALREKYDVVSIELADHLLDF